METKLFGLIYGPDSIDTGGPELVSTSPIDQKVLGTIKTVSLDFVNDAFMRSTWAFKEWRNVPAPQRGELIRLFGIVLRERKEWLANLITVEVGKTMAESLGEVQECIDICDFAVGLSRQLHGLTIASERPQHRLMEQWHPLGVVAIITAFNFPMAVWAWNATIALVCGNSIIWKPSEKTPLCAIACQMALAEAIKRSQLPEQVWDVSTVTVGGPDVGEALVKSGVSLVSATGSTHMGRKVAAWVAPRFGRTLLELGGNAAMIVAPSADLDLAVRAATFSAVGTTGQRCTSLRRLIVHASVYDVFKDKLKAAYGKLVVGDPRDPLTHVGPLIDANAQALFEERLEQATIPEVGTIVCQAKSPNLPCYVPPTVVEVSCHQPFMDHETFAPLLYMMKYSTIEEAIDQNNRVTQGLSSAIMTNDVREAELFCSALGSDCGLANVNIGTSGAEIGGAFGGEKETGGGRESGSDAWKNYMRRQTNTINYSGQLPLAQGVKFDV